jgi:hypothetical protein
MAPTGLAATTSGNAERHTTTLRRLRQIGSLLATIIVTSGFLAQPSLAAQTSSCQAYNPQTCAVTTATAAQPRASGSALPFTGLDLALLGIGGGTLIGSGLVIRGLTRRASGT